MAAPWCSTSTRVASAMTARITCSISRMVRPSALSSRRMAIIRSVSVGRNPAITSSSSSSLGSVASARATSSRLRSGSVNADARCARLSKRSRRRSVSCACARASSTAGCRSSAPMIDIVLDAERRKRPHQLEGAPDAAARRCGRGRALDALAGKRDRALIGRDLAGDHVEQGGLAGAVGADDGEELAGPDAEAHGVERLQAAKALAHRIDRQQRRS